MPRWPQVSSDFLFPIDETKRIEVSLFTMNVKGCSQKMIALPKCEKHALDLAYCVCPVDTLRRLTKGALHLHTNVDMWMLNIANGEYEVTPEGHLCATLKMLEFTCMRRFLITWPKCFDAFCLNMLTAIKAGTHRNNVTPWNIRNFHLLLFLLHKTGQLTPEGKLNLSKKPILDMHDCLAQLREECPDTRVRGPRIRPPRPPKPPKPRVRQPRSAYKNFLGGPLGDAVRIIACGCQKHVGKTGRVVNCGRMKKCTKIKLDNEDRVVHLLSHEFERITNDTNTTRIDKNTSL